MCDDALDLLHAYTQKFMSWYDFSPTELEREYTPASCVEDVQIYLNQYLSAGTRSRQTFRHEKLTYGQHVDEWLWLAPLTNTKNHERKLVVFVHGGFWRRLSADDGTFLTPGFQQLDYDFASINYSLCPNEPLETLIDQTQRAIRFLQTTYNPSNITLIGHSAGAHLIAMALSNNSTIKFAKAILVSGIYDLEPIVKTSVNDATQLNADSAKRLSPINLVSQASNTPITVIWGENETDEFKRQSRDFAASWAQEKTHEQIVICEISKRNHFDVLYDLPTQGVIGLTNG